MPDTLDEILKRSRGDSKEVDEWLERGKKVVERGDRREITVEHVDYKDGDTVLAKHEGTKVLYMTEARRDDGTPILSIWYAIDGHLGRVR